MPELPELEVIRERLADALAGRHVRTAAAPDPFVLRTVEPPLTAVTGARLHAVDRFGKRLLLRFVGDLGLDFHLMRAGRLRLRPITRRPPGRQTLVRIDFEDGLSLRLTEAGTERRASLRVHRPIPGDLARGPEPLAAGFTPQVLATGLRAENRRVKNALRSPDVVAGIGNAYSDEILHAARLSPMRTTDRLTDDEIARLHAAIRRTLQTWIENVRALCPPGSLPEKQTLWRRRMSVHGRAGEPCPVCSDRIERISYRDSETDYCPTCQTGGKLLADRRLSRLGIRRRSPPPSGAR